MTLVKTIAKMRQEYGNRALLEVVPDPFEQFGCWFKEALVFEPNGMTLATVSKEGRPTSRTVLLKSFDKRGFCFFTNYGSRKAKHLEEVPFASLTFWWREVFRQVHIEGRIEKISGVSYFAKRPKGAQIAALCSDQSQSIERDELESDFKTLETKYRGKKVPCPKDWGGYRVIPDRFEFWQGRKNRLHDRFLYTKVGGQWKIQRLAP